VVYAQPTVTDMVSDLLWPERLSILCHPDVAARHAGKDLASFINDNELIHVRIADLPRHYRWAQLIKQERPSNVNVDRGLVFDTSLLAAQYALSGEGLALVDINLFKDDLATKRLVQPFNVILDEGYGYYLITHPEGLSDPAIALFRSWLIEHFGTSPSTTTDTRGTEPVGAFHS